MDINHNLIIAIKASIKAGKAIMDVYNSGNFNVEIKADNSPLTLADKRSNQAIVSDLLLTQLPILSEEGKQIPYEDRKNWEYFWMIDPLDGTKEFIKRNGEFTVNIALIHQGASIAGVIYTPVKDTLYFGAGNVGSFMLESASTHSSSTNFSDLQSVLGICKKLPVQKMNRPFTAVASRSHLSAETQNFIEGLREKHGEVEFISSGSSLKICLVADGTADVYPRLAPTMEWDTAAGHAIATFAGCTINIYDTDIEMGYNKEDLLNPFFVVSRN